MHVFGNIGYFSRAPIFDNIFDSDYSVDLYDGALNEFISPKVQAYGISLTGGGFLGLSGSAGIAYDDEGRVRLIWTIEGSGNAPIDPSMLLEKSKGGLSITGFYSESYDAIDVDDIMGNLVNVYNIEAGHILVAGKSKGKSVSDDSGRQTTWTTVKLGSGTIINIGASGSRTHGIDINEILNEWK